MSSTKFGAISSKHYREFQPPFFSPCWTPRTCVSVFALVPWVSEALSTVGRCYWLLASGWRFFTLLCLFCYPSVLWGLLPSVSWSSVLISPLFTCWKSSSSFSSVPSPHRAPWNTLIFRPLPSSWCFHRPYWLLRVYADRTSWWLSGPGSPYANHSGLHCGPHGCYVCRLGSCPIPLGCIPGLTCQAVDPLRSDHLLPAWTEASGLHFLSDFCFTF